MCVIGGEGYLKIGANAVGIGSYDVQGVRTVANRVAIRSWKQVGENLHSPAVVVLLIIRIATGDVWPRVRDDWRTPD